MNLLLTAQINAQAAAVPLTESTETLSSTFSDLAPPLQMALLLGALSFATAAIVCVTSFTRIVIVLSFVRRALSTQEIPPNPVLIGLSMFLTLFVMGPTLNAIHERALKPLMAAQKIEADREKNAEQSPSSSATTSEEKLFGYAEAWEVTELELKKFMLSNTRLDDLALFFEMSDTKPPYEAMQTPMKIMVPAFVVSELKTAFIMGFCIYIPFLLIDLVVSTILMSLGMMMMPPVVISTPCKLLLFVLIDGWHLIAQSLVTSFQNY